MKDVKCMIEINKEEAKYLREHGVKEGLTRTVKQNSKIKHYYLCEDKYLVELLNNYRNSLSIVMTYGDV
jgi:hypothetical protein